MELDEESSFTITACAAIAGTVFVLFSAFSCQQNTAKQEYDAQAKERQDMISAGYEKKLVPGQRDQIWVKQPEN